MHFLHVMVVFSFSYFFFGGGVRVCCRQSAEYTTIRVGYRHRLHQWCFIVWYACSSSCDPGGASKRVRRLAASVSCILRRNKTTRCLQQKHNGSATCSIFFSLHLFRILALPILTCSDRYTQAHGFPVKAPSSFSPARI